MRILWFNWRDIKHPEAGGAEVLTHEVMRRFVQRGYEMTLFCPKVEGRPSQEQIDGINIVGKEENILYMVVDGLTLKKIKINMIL